MIDQSTINILDLVPTRLKRVAGTGGGEHHGPCPRCGGRDRFAVQPNAPGGGRWSCRQCSPRWGDAVALVMWLEGLDFRAALEHLGLEGSPPQRPTRPTRPARQPQREGPRAGTLRADYACNDPAWQAAAEDFVSRGMDTLHSPQGERARDYLEGRGLGEHIVAAAGLGLNDEDQHQQWGPLRVWLPRGIIIPWHRDGEGYWKINIRRPAGDPKYIQAAGGGNALYWSHTVGSSSTVLLVEGELDALLVRTECPVMLRAGLSTVATGSTAGARVLRWVARLAIAREVLVAMDADEAGDAAAEWWLQALPNARRLRPLAHDVGEMYGLGMSVEEWIRS